MPCYPVRKIASPVHAKELVPRNGKKNANRKAVLARWGSERTCISAANPLRDVVRFLIYILSFYVTLFVSRYRRKHVYWYNYSLVLFLFKCSHVSTCIYVCSTHLSFRPSIHVEQFRFFVVWIVSVTLSWKGFRLCLIFHTHCTTALTRLYFSYQGWCKYNFYLCLKNTAIPGEDKIENDVRVCFV